MPIKAADDQLNGFTDLTIACPVCGAELPNKLRVPTLGFFQYIVLRLPIQKALGTLTTDQRELILTGFCDKHDPFS